MKLKTTIGAFDPVARTVPVRFEQDGIVHDRQVNACLGKSGGYDAAATRLRVDQVGLGVVAKIAVGVITVPVPADELPADPAPATAV